MRVIRRHWKWLLPASVAIVLGLALVVYFALRPEPQPAPEVAPVVTEQPVAEPTTEPAPEPTQDPLPDPEVDIEDPKTMPFTPVWDPPDGGKYFWQVVDPEEGYPETGGTTYVLAHACESQDCAGDVLRDLDAGDTLTYQGHLYEVENTTPVDKDEIGSLPIWAHVEGQLVLFTCIIETTWDQVTKNEIIVANRVD